MNYIINPKEAYLLEQFSSLTFFETMRNNHRLFLDSLEELFEIWWCFKKYAGIKRIHY